MMIPPRQPRKAKQFDCIAMKLRIQERIARETAGMTTEELIAYFRARVAASEFADFLDRPVGESARA